MRSTPPRTCERLAPIALLLAPITRLSPPTPNLALLSLPFPPVPSTTYYYFSSLLFISLPPSISILILFHPSTFHGAFSLQPSRSRLSFVITDAARPALSCPVLCPLDPTALSIALSRLPLWPPFAFRLSPFAPLRPFFAFRLFRLGPRHRQRLPLQASGFRCPPSALRLPLPASLFASPLRASSSPPIIAVVVASSPASPSSHHPPTTTSVSPHRLPNSFLISPPSIAPPPHRFYTKHTQQHHSTPIFRFFPLPSPVAFFSTPFVIPNIPRVDSSSAPPRASLVVAFQGLCAGRLALP